MKPRVKSQNTRREIMSPRKWSGQEGENSIVIFRFIEVSKVDRCAGYGFLLVSPTQEGYTGGLASLATKAALATWLSSFPREKERRILLSFHARCLTLIFLFLFLVKDKIFFSRRYPSCYRSLNTVYIDSISIKWYVFYENTKRRLHKWHYKCILINSDLFFYSDNSSILFC